MIVTKEFFEQRLKESKAYHRLLDHSMSNQYTVWLFEYDDISYLFEIINNGVEINYYMQATKI